LARYPDFILFCRFSVFRKNSPPTTYESEAIAPVYIQISSTTQKVGAFFNIFKLFFFPAQLPVRPAVYQVPGGWGATDVEEDEDYFEDDNENYDEGAHEWLPDDEINDAVE